MNSSVCEPVFIEPLPEGNKQISFWWTIVMAILSFQGLVWMFLRRQYRPLRGRDNGILLVLVIGIWLLFNSTLIREFYGRERFPCDVYLWSQQMCIPFICGPLVVRMLQYKNKIEWQDAMINVPLDPSGSDESTALMKDFMARKYLASRRNAYQTTAKIVLVYVLIVLVYYLLEPQYNAGCVGCGSTTKDIILFLTAVLATAIMIIITLIKLRRSTNKYLHKSEDVKQLIIVCTAFSITMIVWSIVYSIDHNQLHEKGELTWSYLLTLTASWVQLYQIHWQTYKTYSSGNSLHRLSEVLDDPAMHVAFENFLKFELSLENLRFWVEARKFRNTFPEEESNASNGSESNGFRQLARDIYNLFIREGSALQINLSSKCRRRLGKTFEMDDNQMYRRNNDLESNVNTINRHTFDQAIDEIYQLMERDSFRRFVLTREFISWKNRGEVVETIHSVSFSRMNSRSDSLRLSDLGEHRISSSKL